MNITPEKYKLNVCLFYFFSHFYVKYFSYSKCLKVPEGSCCVQLHGMKFIIISSQCRVMGFKCALLSLAVCSFGMSVLSIPTLNYTCLFIYIYFYKLHVCDNNILHLFSFLCVYTHMCHRSCMEVRGQLQKSVFSLSNVDQSQGWRWWQALIHWSMSLAQSYNHHFP